MEKKRILLAGMSEADADRIREHLSECAYQIRLADVDVDVLEQLRSFQPQLVLLDSSLDRFDAFDTCKRIKADSTALVLFVTPLSARKEIELAIESGTDDFLFKPLNRAELQKRVENLLRIHDCV